MLDISDLRKEYRLHTLDLKDLDLDPFMQFQKWFQETQKANLLEPNAMILATASALGRPSSRTVLLKGINAKGFLFFTNYESRKAKELKENPFASATFLWKEIERQVIVEGAVERIPREESEAYFALRSRGSQLSTWASHQDQPISSRTVLEQEYERIERKYKGKEVPLPPYWGGYCLLPQRFEFWQGRENRLHDRFCYEQLESGWKIQRLSP